MNHNLAPSAPALIQGQRQQPPPNVQKTHLVNGMNYYATPPNAQHPQSYNGYSDNQSRGNPILSLPESAMIVPNPNMGATRYDVYYANGPQGYQPSPNYYYPPNYQQMPLQMMPGGYVPISQGMAGDASGQYIGQYPGNVSAQSGYQIQHQQPQTQNAQLTQPRKKTKILIRNPVTGAVINEEEEKSLPEPTPEVKKEELPVLTDNAEDAQQRFRAAISDRVKSDEPAKELGEKPEVPQVQTAASIVQPAPASSAPPPSVSDDSVLIQPSVKAASVEPTIKIDAPPVPLNDNNSTVERAPSPIPVAVPDTKEQAQEEEDTEKLLDLERQFTDLYEKSGESIEKQEYSFEVLDIIREIVKCYKKTLLPVEMDLLKKKGLDVHSELPQQMQNRSKYMNTSNAFNPGWNNNQQQIVGNRNKLYAGRHSDNKMRKKGSVTGRPSYGGIRHPPPPPVLDLRKAENAWKPKRRDDSAANEEEKKYEAARKEIRSILNKITPTSYDELIEQFFAIDVGQNERYQQIAIELIFDKAVEEPKFCSLYTKLCKEQVDRGNRVKGSFFHTLIQKVQTTFEGTSAFEENLKEISTKLEGETDEKKKADLEERLEMLKDKEKRYILGNIKFISHLYTVDLIADQVISFCLSKLHKMFDATKDDIYVQYGIELLELISKIYFGDEKTKQRQVTNKGPDNVQSFINWVSTENCKNAVSTKIKVMIMNFEDFMRAGYNKRNADKGPKTIQQLHEDIRKEEEVRKTERLAYEAQQKQQRDDRYRQPYSGRGSQDRKNVQDKRTSAAMASNNTAITAPSRNFNLKETMKDNSGTTKLGGKSSYFNKKNEEPGKIGGNAVDGKTGEWSTAGGKRSGSGGQNHSRRSSIERN